MFEKVQKFKDPAKQDVFEFLKKCDSLARTTGLAEEHIKTCFINAVDLPVVTWASGLDEYTNSLQEFVEAFVREFFSADAQKRLRQRFEKDQAPKEREEFIQYCDGWYATLSKLTKPKLEQDEILELLINKMPNWNLATVLRCTPNLSYNMFRELLRK